jgi:hypothetical protein
MHTCTLSRHQLLGLAASSVLRTFYCYHGKSRQGSKHQSPTFIALHQETISLLTINMRSLIAHPGLQFWVYKLQGRLTYTHYVPGQLPRKYTLYGYEFKGMPEGGEGIHRQTMVHRGGIFNSFSAAFVEEMSIVVMRVDGKLDIEYHYKEGFTEVIYQKSGP